MNMRHSGIASSMVGLAAALSLTSALASPPTDLAVHATQLTPPNSFVVNCNNAVTNAPHGQWNQLLMTVWWKDEPRAYLEYTCNDANRMSSGSYTFEFDCQKNSTNGRGATRTLTAANHTIIIARPGIATHAETCQQLMSKINMSLPVNR